MTGPKISRRRRIRAAPNARRRPSISRRPRCPARPGMRAPTPSPEPVPGSLRRQFRPGSSRRVSGPVAAALVIGVAWMLGWPAPAAARRRQMPRHRRSRRADRRRRIEGSASLRPRARSGGGRARRRAGEIARRVARRTRRPARAVGQTRRRGQRREIGAARIRRRRICPRSTSASPGSSAPCARKAPRSRRRAQSRPTTCRCAASWRRRCSTFWFGPAIPIRRRWRRRNRWRRIRMR